MDRPSHQYLTISLPSWVFKTVTHEALYRTDEEMMGLAIALARHNVLRQSGGPFGAAIFERVSGRLVSVGLNMVEAGSNSVLHAEIVAIMFAQAELRSFSLKGADLPDHVLAASCEPCAMCLGAVFGSGVGRIVCGASRDDAQAIGFDEGPVFPDSFRYLEERGIEVVRGVRADEARAVLGLYRDQGGLIYQRI